MDTALSAVSGEVRSRAEEAGEKGLCPYAAACHARQFLSDTKTPLLLLPSISGAGNGFLQLFGKRSCPQQFHTRSSGHWDTVYLAWGLQRNAKLLLCFFYIMTRPLIRKFVQHPGPAGPVGILGITLLQRHNEDKLSEQAIFPADRNTVSCCILETKQFFLPLSGGAGQGPSDQMWASAMGRCLDPSISSNSWGD